MMLHEAIQEFLIAIEADGVSESTIIWYRSILKSFSTALGAINLASIGTKEIRLYLIEIRHDYSEDTLHAHKRVLHKFWRWCADEYGITSPMRNIRYPSVPKRSVPKAAEIRDIARLFDVIPNDVQGKRDKAIIAFLSDTGCRAGGLVSLTMDRLDMQNRTAIVTEKGRKSRRLWFTDFTAGLLQTWLDVKPDCDYVFINLRTYDPLSVSGLNQMLKRYKRKAGIKGRTNPHSFRHAFAREYLRNGGDLATLSKILGHADVATTAAHYAIFTEDELGKRHEQLSPVSKLKESIDKQNDER